ncbi:MAG: hypothetical protein D4R64_10570 [Porphyromonadaceae bacterium]|nr:MAG: hypothetical protein D4R64_10570 [Porphyromonadaceae bacterium]
MDYIDTVYVDLKQRLPGKYPLAGLREPEKFKDAVKSLIDGEWLLDVSFSNDYNTLIISEPDPIMELKAPRKVTWYDLNIEANVAE